MIMTVLMGLVNIIMAPLLLGVVNKTKAFFAGRKGVPLLQVYYDLWKLFRKTPVYSRTTSWLFLTSPMVGVVAVLGATAFIPWYGTKAVFSFSGDIIVFAYFLAMQRFFTVLAALDTGSAFEGMGASREVWLATLSEPAFFICLGTLTVAMQKLSLSGILVALSENGWQSFGPVLILIVAALFIIWLAENARIPVDDPNTHLELTMVHEVMVLDHSGPDLGFILLASAIKLWITGIIIIKLLLPICFENNLFNALLDIAGIIVLGIGLGIVESTMARLRLIRIPQLLIAAGAFAVLGLILVLR